MTDRATITSDQCFIEALDKYWGIPEDAALTITKHDLRGILKMIRQKLITLTKGVNDEFVMRNNFRTSILQSGPIVNSVG